MLQLLIKNGVYVNSDGEFCGDLAIKDGKITHIGMSIDAEAENIINAKGKYILPGIVDTHVHLPWPSSNFDSVDDFSSGTTAAVYGGVTTIIEYIVPDESGNIIPALENEIVKARDKSLVDYSFHLILRKVTKETLLEMAEAVKRGFTSFKIYTAYQGFRLNDDEVLQALQTAKEIGAIVCFHAEDGILVNFASEQLIKNGHTNIRYYPEAHPRLADIEATQRVVNYAKQTGTRVHIVHVNTKEGAEIIGSARNQGLPITGETCPQYLMFTDSVYKSGRPEANYFVLAPVIREENDQSALWKAILLDELQTVATDHCPYNREQKLKNGSDFRYIPGGAGGIETSLPILYSYGVKSGKITLPRLVEIMATNPARIFNLFPQKGIIAVGSDADLVIYDPVGKNKIENTILHSNTDHTLYEGFEVFGRLETTILRGKVIIHNGQMVAKTPSGKLLKRPGY